MSTPLERFARGIGPEVLGALLAVLSFVAGPPLGRFMSRVNSDLRAAAVAGFPSQHAWLGIEFSPDPGSSPGAAVTAVDGHGASAGILQPGDVITTFDGSPVSSGWALRDDLVPLAAGTVVHLTVERGHQLLHVAVQLSSSP